MTTSPKEDSTSDAPANDARVPADDASGGSDPTAATDTDANTLPPELGGQKGPEPTRYGDWENKGRCTDF